MTNDERAIRDLVDTWLKASKAGDLPTVLNLMSDDVVFMVPGQEPFGKETFAAASEGAKDLLIEGTSDILELQILGDWAYMRCRLDMTITPKNAAPIRRSGYTLSILRKMPDRRWVIACDANLVTKSS